MNSKESAALARKLFDIYNAHDLDEAEKYATANSETLTVPTGERAVGIEAGRRDNQRWLTAFPDMHFEILDLAAGEDFAAVEIRFRATHLGPLLLPDGELPATGKAVDARGCFLLRFQDGKVLTEHQYFDRMTLLEQLGVMPGARPSASAEQRPVP